MPGRFLSLEGESAERWYNMRHERQGWMSASENQIVVYQPNETVRLDVRLENETVWLTQAQLCALFGVVKSNISYHLKNIFGTNELDYGATVQKIRTVRLESGRNVARESATTASSSLTARRSFGPVPRSKTLAASLSRGCLRTLRVRLLPNLPSEMLRISAAHLGNGRGSHSRPSRFNPQGNVGKPRIWKRKAVEVEGMTK